MVFIILFALCRKGSAKNILFLMNPLAESLAALREKEQSSREGLSLAKPQRTQYFSSALDEGLLVGIVVL